MQGQWNRTTPRRCKSCQLGCKPGKAWAPASSEWSTATDVNSSHTYKRVYRSQSSGSREHPPPPLHLAPSQLLHLQQLCQRLQLDHNSEAPHSKARVVPNADSGSRQSLQTRFGYAKRVRANCLHGIRSLCHPSLWCQGCCWGRLVPNVPVHATATPSAFRSPRETASVNLAFALKTLTAQALNLRVSYLDNNVNWPVDGERDHLMDSASVFKY